MRTLAVYVLAGTAAGAAAGAAMGVLGGGLSESVRAVLGTFLGLAAVGAGGASLVGRGGSRPLQCDRETPKEWVRRGPLAWAVLNGAALGFGALSRLGFWLWYAIPIGSLLLASPAIGAIIWGAYGFTRTAGAGALWFVGTRNPGLEQAWPVYQRDRAALLATALMTAIGMAAFLLFGL